MNPTALRRVAPLLSVCVLAVLAGALYTPFLDNPRMFDDWVFFSGQQFAYYATHPFGLGIRVPPLFSLAVTEVLVGGMAAHRLVNLAVHVACALALYALAVQLLRAALEARAPRPAGMAPDAVSERGIQAAALTAAGLFVIHPVAVYGAGYLMQRTILFATLFALLSLTLFVRGLRRASHADAVSAGLMYALAVLSKEHSLMLPALALLSLPLVQTGRRFAVRHASIYLVCCAPAAIFVVALSLWLVGRAYEPNIAIITGEVESGMGTVIQGTPWGLSAVTQAGLFFKYLALWLWPDTAAMSIDLRVDFFSTWSLGWAVLKVATFAAFGLFGVLLLARRGSPGVAGLGLLWTWVLFLIEMSTARFQEPFVLYRSYLWAPGLLVALAAVLVAVRLRFLATGFVLVGALLFHQAHDRLGSFSSLLRVWEDAVAKLPAVPVPGGSRTLFNLAREYVYAERGAEALRIAQRCATQYRDAFYCHTTYGMIYHQAKDYARALPYLERAAALNPTEGVTQFRVGVVLESLGRIEEAKARYRRAVALGFGGAALALKRFEPSVAPDGGGRPGAGGTGHPRPAPRT